MSATTGVQIVRDRAAWLLDPALGTCVVGSGALAEACRRVGLPGPEVRDLDLAWAPDTEAGRALLEEHGVFLPTTRANLERGTLAMRLADQRVEVTSFRGSDPSAPLTDRISADLSARDMTIGALAWHIDSDLIHDPFDGVAHWRENLIAPVGKPAERIAEHPVRWLRYYRKAHELGFELSPKIRKVRPDPLILGRIPPEALAAEFRAALVDLPSPGQWMLELHEAGGLESLLPELAAQFDGRPAGPVRHHPEIGQSLHMVLALEWAAKRCRDLQESDRLTVMLAVLCHDLGKGLTEPDSFPSHPGHENSGLPVLRRMFARLPSIADAATVRLCEQVCSLHLVVRKIAELRPGTLAGLYEDHFRGPDYPVDLFALAVGADSGGRLGREQRGDTVARQVAADIRWLRECCERVDAAALREQFEDTQQFRTALHEARARAIRHGR